MPATPHRSPCQYTCGTSSGYKYNDFGCLPSGLARACGTPSAASTPSPQCDVPFAARLSARRSGGPLSTPRRFPSGHKWPDDLTNLIMKFSGAGLPSLASVCQNTRELADDSEVWRGAYASEFPSGGDVEDFGALPEALWRPCLLRARMRRG